MDVVKTAWVYIWITVAAAEVGLSVWLHSATFLGIGSVASLMVAYNLQRHIRNAARTLAESVA
jgi:hypothetical protein